MKNLFQEVEGLGLGSINLLALITKNSSDVVFYANINGKLQQSNTIVESGAFDPARMRDFYLRVADIIRASSSFKPEKMNVVTISGSQFNISYMDLDCSVFSLKKTWKESFSGTSN